MLENKHYGRQILLSLFVTVFLLVGLLYVSVRFLIPLYRIDQQQIYDVLIRMFPILIGLIMIEIGVLVARRRDEDYVDEVDKLPPNAYDKPLYTLPGDDPSHLHSDELTYGQALVRETEKPMAREPMQAISESTASAVPGVEPLGPMVEISASANTYDTSFDSILALELENSISMDYDLTLTLVDVESEHKDEALEKLLALSTDRAYSYRMENGTLAMILPFYNQPETDDYLESLVADCKEAFGTCTFSTASASRNGRSIDADTLYREAERKLGPEKPNP
jgi:hypothetical protein